MTIEDAIIKLAISYLAIGNQAKSCENFYLVGDNTNFKVRNYINIFCK